jgi:hypothetical protein
MVVHVSTSPVIRGNPQVGPSPLSAASLDKVLINDEDFITNINRLRPSWVAHESPRFVNATLGRAKLMAGSWPRGHPLHVELPPSSPQLGKVTVPRPAFPFLVHDTCTMWALMQWLRQWPAGGIKDHHIQLQHVDRLIMMML